MSKRQFRILMLLTVISGLVGGGLSDWLFRSLPASGAQTTTAPKVIEAQEFCVVDKEGNTRGKFGISEKGIVRLGLYEAAGKRTIGLVLEEHGVYGLVLFDGPENRRVDLGVTQDGTIGFNLYDADGKALFSAPRIGGDTALPSLLTTASVVESRIDGEFEGWSGETIFKLANGQIWQQSSYDYTYHYAYRPKVIIFRTAGGYKMKVDGVDDTIYVTRLN